MGQRLLATGVKGLVESSPQMAVAAVDPVLGALAFGQRRKASPETSALALVSPVVGKYSGAITEAIASKRVLPATWQTPR